jgi:hypothetical protein
MGKFQGRSGSALLDLDLKRHIKSQIRIRTTRVRIHKPAWRRGRLSLRAETQALFSWREGSLLITAFSPSAKERWAEGSASLPTIREDNLQILNLKGLGKDILYLP